ncbi:MAG: hypothetical protein WDM76_07855 [Limisphaerales bacterium]
MAYREEMRTSYTRGRSRSVGGGEFAGETGTESAGGTTHGGDDAKTWNESHAASAGTSSTWTEAETESTTESSVLIPVHGQGIVARPVPLA